MNLENGMIFRKPVWFLETHMIFRKLAWFLETRIIIWKPALFLENPHDLQTSMIFLSPFFNYIILGIYYI